MYRERKELYVALHANQNSEGGTSLADRTDLLLHDSEKTGGANGVGQQKAAKDLALKVTGGDRNDQVHLADDQSENGFGGTSIYSQAGQLPSSQVDNIARKIGPSNVDQASKTIQEGDGMADTAIKEINGSGNQDKGVAQIGRKFPEQEQQTDEDRRGIMDRGNGTVSTRIVQSPFGYVQGPLGDVQGPLGVVQGPMGLVQGPTGVVQSPTGDRTLDAGKKAREITDNMRESRGYTMPGPITPDLQVNTLV